MNNFNILEAIFFGSVILGLIKYGSLSDYYEGKSWQLKIIEFWNDFINYFVAGILAYYFVMIRLPLLLDGQSLTIADALLFVIFLFGIFGHLCVISNKVSEAIGEYIKEKLKSNPSSQV